MSKRMIMVNQGGGRTLPVANAHNGGCGCTSCRGSSKYALSFPVVNILDGPDSVLDQPAEPAQNGRRGKFGIAAILDAAPGGSVLDENSR